MEITKENVSLEFWMGYLQCLFDFQVTKEAKQYGKDYKADVADWSGNYDDGLTPQDAIREDLTNA